VFFSSRRRHTRCYRDWSSDVCSSDLGGQLGGPGLPVLPVLLDIVDVLIEKAGSAENLATAVAIKGAPIHGSTIRRFREYAGKDRSEERRVGKECRGGG